MTAAPAPEGFGRRWWAVLALVVTALTLRAFAPALGWGITDADGWADVAWARHPLSEQLLVPLTGGVGGDNANFWRPAFMVEFWVLRRLFGWEAFGYHAWDLLLHVVVSLLAGAFVARWGALTGRPSRALTALTAVLFAAHPLAEEIVPAVARNIDLLLGVGFFGALVALVALVGRRRDGRPGGWAAWIGLVALALGSKESGVLLLPLAVLAVGLLRVDLPLRARAGEAARVAGPLVPLVGAYLAVRHHVLGGLGGYYEEGERTLGYLLQFGLSRGFIEPVVPSIAYLLRGHREPLVFVVTALAWAVASWVAWRSPHRRLAVFGLGFFVLFVLLFTLTGTMNRRVVYVPTLGAVAFLAVVLHEAWTARRWLGMLVGAAWLATFVHGSPAVRRYPDWGESARAGDVWMDLDFWRAIPARAPVWLLDRPYRVDIDPRRFRLWGGDQLGLAHTPVSYSIQAWLDEMLGEDAPRVHVLTLWYLRAPMSEQTARVEPDGNGLRVTRTGGWRDDDVRGPFRGETEGDTLRITPTRKAREVVVVVWTGEGMRRWDPPTVTWPPARLSTFPGAPAGRR